MSSTTMETNPLIAKYLKHVSNDIAAITKYKTYREPKKGPLCPEYLGEGLWPKKVFMDF